MDVMNFYQRWPLLYTRALLMLHAERLLKIRSQAMFLLKLEIAWWIPARSSVVGTAWGNEGKQLIPFTCQFFDYGINNFQSLTQYAGFPGRRDSR